MKGASKAEPIPLGVTPRFALFGALGGLLVALGDFGALWLWLPDWGNRMAFLGRLLALEVPLGAWVGAALGVALGDRRAVTPWSLSDDPLRENAAAALARMGQAPEEVMPTTRWGSPPTVISVPSTSGSPPRRPRHSECEIATSRCAAAGFGARPA